MSSPRLRVQFETLFEHFDGQNMEVHLEDVTDILFCTRRNARIVLNKMEEEGWIEWHPAAGRGKLSHLIFKRSRNDVSENLARRYLEEGKFGQAFSVLDQNADKLTQVIQNYLGIQHQQGLQVVRLPYYRPLSMLNPRKPMRRSEQHIARQVFSGLTTFDENEMLQPDLAHSWQSLSANHWRFYLRPGVRFHNGQLLTSALVVDSLCELQHFRLFHHIEEVSSPGDWVIDIHLSKPDFHLPTLLAETCARIVSPNVQQENEFDIMPVGTGPFKVVINDDKRLILEAFDSYFGYRPLLDQIEVCVIDEADSSLVFPTLNTPLKLRRGASREDVDLDPGCIYLQLNRRDGIACDRVWAEYLSSKLSALSLFSLLPEETVVTWGMLPAHGLKPGWYHHRPCRQIILPAITRPVRIAYHAKHPMFPHLVDVIQTLLTQDGIQVELSTYEHAVDVTQEIDIWIKAMGISNHRDDALAGWLLDYSHVSQTSQPEDFAGWQQLIDCWRTEPEQPFPARDIGKSLIEKYQIVPLFHSWFGISHDQCGALQNAKCNALGWFDFGRVWVKPELD